jgi:hypothetical protein
LNHVEPYAEVEGNRIAKATFYPNGSFEAVGERNDEELRSKGIYCYDPIDGFLTLMMKDKVLCYDASVSDHALRMTGYRDCFATTAVLRRTNVCPVSGCLPGRCAQLTGADCAGTTHLDCGTKDTSGVCDCGH